MKSSKKMAVTLLLFLTAFAFNSIAQKAALYDFAFYVPDEFRKQIQAYDASGNKKYKQELLTNERVLDRSPEHLSKKEVNEICDMAKEMVQRKFGYIEVTVMFPLKGEYGFGRLNDFPGEYYKKAVKKLSADAYIAIEIQIENKEPLRPGSAVLEILNVDTDRIMYFDISSKYTIYDGSKRIVSEKELKLSDFKEDLNNYFDKYKKEVDEKGRFKLWKAYLTKEDITGIYKIVEQKLEEPL